MKPTEMEGAFLFPDFWTVCDDTGCWVWEGSISPEGYGRWNSLYTHRLVLIRVGIEIPPGWHVDHLCRNRKCCNPDHLEVVTHAENVRRGKAGEVNRARMLAQTHCARGHEFTPENTWHGKKQRACRTCGIARQREKRAQLRAKRSAS